MTTARIPFASRRSDPAFCLQCAQDCFVVARASGARVAEVMTWFWLFRWVGMPE